MRVLAALLLSALPAYGQIDGPKSVNLKAGRLGTVRVVAEVDAGTAVKYEVFGGTEAGDVEAFREYEEPDPKEAKVAGADKKVLRIKVIGYEAGTRGFVMVMGVRNGAPIWHLTTVNVKRPDPPPEPPEPVPPGPPPVPPGPTPPGPGPTPPPTPAPIPADGLHMLVVYESGDAYPSAQVQSWRAKKVFDYLKSKGAAGNWRVWDRNADASGDDKKWQDAFARARTKPMPYVIVSNGRTGYEGPAPANADELLALLKKYGD